MKHSLSFVHLYHGWGPALAYLGVCGISEYVTTKASPKSLFQRLDRRAHAKIDKGAERHLDLEIAKGFIDEDSHGPIDIRFGRLWIAVGALALALGFVGPFVRLEDRETQYIYSALNLAAVRAQNLWNIPMVVCALLYLLMTRATRFQMMRIWPAYVVLGCMPLLSSIYSAFRVIAGVKTASSAVAMHFGWGIYFLVLGSLLVAWGGIHMGRRV